jgi:hypothetical protein
MPVVQWVRHNKLSSVLLVILCGVGVSAIPTLKRQSSFMGESVSVANYAARDSVSPVMMKSAIGGGAGTLITPPDIAPQAAAPNRLTIQESNVSLLVGDVTKTRDDVIAKAQSFGGYMVSSDTSNPGETPNATVIVRVPAEKLKDMLALLKGMAIKVVSENLSGYDVTDQYVDVDKRIALLEKTKAKFMTILDSAKEISDITNLNREIITIQEQIDSYKGSQDALAKNADLARLTVYLSTDEIALPYAPDTTWRPTVIFKLAVRQLVTDLRGIGTNAIWVLVYGVIWIPTLVIAWFVWKFVRTKRR